jgi:hypothetical protein
VFFAFLVKLPQQSSQKATLLRPLGLLYVGMRLNGENGEEEEEGVKVVESLNSQAYSIGVEFSQPQSQKLVVGYALTPKKKKSFLQPKLLSLAGYNLTHIVSFPYIPSKFTSFVQFLMIPFYRIEIGYFYHIYMCVCVCVCLCVSVRLYVYVCVYFGVEGSAVQFRYVGFFPTDLGICFLVSICFGYFWVKAAFAVVVVFVDSGEM